MNTTSTLEDSLILLLQTRKETLATAESCTGGLLAYKITNVPGSSVVFYGGIVAYSNSIKQNLLHIPVHSWFPDEVRFLEAGWVYHFNAIPKNDRHVSYWMERTYKELYT